MRNIETPESRKKVGCCHVCRDYGQRRQGNTVDRVVCDTETRFICRIADRAFELTSPVIFSRSVTVAKTIYKSYSPRITFVL